MSEKQNKLRYLAHRMLLTEEFGSGDIIIPENAIVERISGGWTVEAKIIISDFEYDFHTQLTEAIAKTAG